MVGAKYSSFNRVIATALLLLLAVTIVYAVTSSTKGLRLVVSKQKYCLNESVNISGYVPGEGVLEVANSNTTFSVPVYDNFSYSFLPH